MDVSITFQSVGGNFNASISGSQLIKGDNGKTRNNPFYTETISPETRDFRGIDVEAVLVEGQGCAVVAQAKLGLK